MHDCLVVVVNDDDRQWSSRWTIVYFGCLFIVETGSIVRCRFLHNGSLRRNSISGRLIVVAVDLSLLVTVAVVVDVVVVVVVVDDGTMEGCVVL
jgi:hypothetical protein